MQEEFHGDGDGIGYKRLYGWGTINANVWLPSLSELVGIAGNQNTNTGVYLSAMQGLNVSVLYDIDSKGGIQFAYFKQFNLSGGGEKLWDACNGQLTWLRSSYTANQYSWLISGLNRFNAYSAFPLTASYAVHPVVDASSISLASTCGESSLIPLFLLSTKRHARLVCSLVNALSTARTCYHLFVGKGRTGNKLILLKKRRINNKEKE